MCVFFLWRSWIERHDRVLNRAKNLFEKSNQFSLEICFHFFFFLKRTKMNDEKNFQSTFWHTRAPRLLLNRLAVWVVIDHVFVPVAISYLFRNIMLWNSIDNALSRFRCHFWPIPLFDISCRFFFGWCLLSIRRAHHDIPDVTIGNSNTFLFRLSKLLFCCNAHTRIDWTRLLNS